MRIGTAILIVWLIIGAIAGGQRHRRQNLASAVTGKRSTTTTATIFASLIPAVWALARSLLLHAARFLSRRVSFLQSARNTAADLVPDQVLPADKSAGPTGGLVALCAFAGRLLKPELPQ